MSEGDVDVVLGSAAGASPSLSRLLPHAGFLPAGTQAWTVTGTNHGPWEARHDGSGEPMATHGPALLQVLPGTSTGEGRDRAAPGTEGHVAGERHSHRNLAVPGGVGAPAQPTPGTLTLTSPPLPSPLPMQVLPKKLNARRAPEQPG